MLAREIGLILTIGAVALVQVTLLIMPLGFSAPLMLVLVICRTLIGVGSPFPDTGITRGFRWALYGGLALDILTATPLGSHALALLLAAFVIAAVTSRMRVDRPLLLLLAMTAASPIHDGILALLIQPGPIDWASTARVALIPGLLVALIMTLPAFFVLRWLLRGQL